MLFRRQIIKNMYIKHMNWCKTIKTCRTITNSQQNIRYKRLNEEENGKKFMFTQMLADNGYRRNLFPLLSAAGLVVGVYYWLFHDDNIVNTEPIKNESKLQYKNWHKQKRFDLPNFSLEDVRNHTSIEEGVWVTYGIGVYDITEFIPKHPGSSEKIIMAAGSAIDPFWALYQQHNTEEILTLLEQYRIGNIENVEQESKDNKINSPWAYEPKRNSLLKVTSQQPFNAEPPLYLLRENFYTPNDIFYVRNHLPVPVIDEKKYELDIETINAHGKIETRTLTYENIKRLPKHTVTAAIMCGGNRRSEMAAIKPIKGLSWEAGAVGNAKWSGVLLRDLLLEMGVKKKSNENLHVIFEGADLDITSHPYGASIPLAQALDERADVLLAYEMNGEPLSRDHGFPLRAIIPGTVGARNVKWLTRIIVSENESDSHWQQNDYKGFSPSTDWDTVDFKTSPAIQAMPVTSAICTPANGQTVNVNPNGTVTVQGYAWSGGGRRIVRVDLTADHGENWYVAELEQENLPDGQHYGWSFWKAEIPLKNEEKEIEIWAKAVDSSYNVQPESFKNIWNLRGVLSNAYHKVKIYLSYPKK